MHATTHQTASGRLLLPACVVVLGVLSLIPARFLGWVGWFTPLIHTALAPISHPLRSWSSALSPAQRGHDNAQLKRMREEAEGWQTLYLREHEENRRLQQQLSDLAQGMALNPELPVSQIVAPVIGTASDLSSGLLSVRTGRRANVDRNTVATTSGLQLVGKVTRTAGPVCMVQPITRKAAGPLGGKVMVGPQEGVACVLAPAGDGTLRGHTAETIRSVIPGAAPSAAPELAVGQTVRLDDPNWPRSARMLVIGTIEAIEPSPTQPLRRMIVVRPTVELERVSEVYLRLVGHDDHDDGAESP